MNSNLLIWIQEWLAQYCDGNWEHDQNFTITTIDNPGWGITIKLVGTRLEYKNFSPINVENSETDWFYCTVKDNHFLGDGGVRNLIDMLEIFRNWAGN